MLLCTWIALTPATAQDSHGGPPAECEDAQRCAYDERLYPHEALALFSNVRRAINRMSPVDLDVDEDALELSAAFRVFFFLDDLKIMLQPEHDGTRLYIRSASRSTFWDGGTNKRRIGGFFDRLDDLLERSQSEDES